MYTLYLDMGILQLLYTPLGVYYFDHLKYPFYTPNIPLIFYSVEGLLW